MASDLTEKLAEEMAAWSWTEGEGDMTPWAHSLVAVVREVLLSDQAVEAGAEALNDHLKGSGNWRNATPAMARRVLEAACLDAVGIQEPE